MDLQVWSEELEMVPENILEVPIKLENFQYLETENGFLNDYYDATFVKTKNKNLLRSDELLIDGTDCQVRSKSENHPLSSSPSSGYRSSAQKSYTCDQCGKEFYLASHLKTHSKIHASEKNFHCTVCDGAFVDASSLRRHITKHTGEKPYKCEECGKTFSIPNNLKKHIRTHTGEKPYICSVCSKSFASGSNLKTHLKSHAGERPYSCDICDKAFTLKGHLVTHRRIHYPEKMYSCHRCDRLFRVASSLKRHLLIHEELKSLVTCKTDITSSPKISDIKNEENNSSPLLNKFTPQVAVSDSSGLSSLPDKDSCEIKDSLISSAGNKCNSTCGTRMKVFLNSSGSGIKVEQPTINYLRCNNTCSQLEQDGKFTLQQKLVSDPVEVAIKQSESSLEIPGNESSKLKQKYSCSSCNRGFNTSTMLEEHSKAHSALYTCKFCTTSFTEASSLGRHMRKHLT